MKPGSRGYTRAIVAAQMLAQIGAFALPALLPGYIARWDLSKTEAGWLVGIFFAAYVVMVPVLVALTDRVPPRRVYMFGTGLTALAHLGFALVADGFWSGMLFEEEHDPLAQAGGPPDDRGIGDDQGQDVAVGDDRPEPEGRS
jgi:putative copper export protein